MNERDQQWEQRSSRREAADWRLWWMGRDGAEFSPGWASDSSKSGLAFVTSDRNEIAPGDTVSITRSDPRRDAADCETMRVCRVQHHGPAARLIACTRFP